MKARILNFIFQAIFSKKYLTFKKFAVYYRQLSEVGPAITADAYGFDRKCFRCFLSENRFFRLLETSRWKVFLNLRATLKKDPEGIKER